MSYFTLKSIRMKVTISGGRMNKVLITNQKRTFYLTVTIEVKPALSVDVVVTDLGAK